MAENSAIEWTDHTFNPWWGCTRVSPACNHCYAETLAKRFGTGWGDKADRKFFGDKHWNDPLRWNRSAERSGVRARVFCASMADVFEARPELAEQRMRLWNLIDNTPMLDWLLLTKRPENVRDMVPTGWLTEYGMPAEMGGGRVGNWPANAWVGTTVENQRYADERIPHLLEVPAPVLFLSCEPLLGPLDLSRYLPGDRACWDGPEPRTIGWVIAGGESGRGARPMHPEWARDLRDAATAAGVAFLFKQWGDWQPLADWRDPTATHAIRSDSGHVVEIAPMGERTFADEFWSALRRPGKKSAGRELDGRTWDGLPRCPADTDGDGGCGRQNCPHCEWRRP